MAELSELIQKDFNFIFNIGKGKIVEMIIEKFLISIGCEVKKIGVEYAVEGFLADLQQQKDEVPEIANLLRTLPDFLVRCPDKNIRFVEVKYRANGSIDKYTLEKYPKGVDFLIVSLREIFYITDEQKESLLNSMSKNGWASLDGIADKFKPEIFIASDRENDLDTAYKNLEKIKKLFKWQMDLFPPELADEIKGLFDEKAVKSVI